MCVAESDHLTPAELAIAAFARANEPKRLVILPAGTSTPTSTASTSRPVRRRDWFAEHLLERSEPGAGRFSRAAGTVGAAG